MLKKMTKIRRSYCDSEFQDANSDDDGDKYNQRVKKANQASEVYEKR